MYDDYVGDEFYDHIHYDLVVELEEPEPINVDEPVTEQEVLDDWEEWYEEYKREEKRLAEEARAKEEEFDAFDFLPTKITARRAAIHGMRMDRKKRDDHRNASHHDICHAQMRARRKMEWNKERNRARRAAARWRQQRLAECDRQRDDMGLVLILTDQPTPYGRIWMSDEIDEVLDDLDDYRTLDDCRTIDGGPGEHNNYYPYSEEFYAWHYAG